MEPQGSPRASPGLWKLAVSCESWAILKVQITKVWFLEVIVIYRKSKAAVSEVLVIVRQFPKPLRGQTSDTVFVVPEKKLPFMKWKLPYSCSSTASISFWASIFSWQTCTYPTSISEELLYIYEDWWTNHRNLYLDSGASTDYNKPRLQLVKSLFFTVYSLI